MSKTQPIRRTKSKLALQTAERKRLSNLRHRARVRRWSFNRSIPVFSNAYEQGPQFASAETLDNTVKTNSTSILEKSFEKTSTLSLAQALNEDAEAIFKTAQALETLREAEQKLEEDKLAAKIEMSRIQNEHLDIEQDENTSIEDVVLYREARKEFGYEDEDEDETQEDSSFEEEIVYDDQGNELLRMPKPRFTAEEIAYANAFKKPSALESEDLDKTNESFLKNQKSSSNTEEFRLPNNDQSSENVVNASKHNFFLQDENTQQQYDKAFPPTFVLDETQPFFVRISKKGWNLLFEPRRARKEWLQATKKDEEDNIMFSPFSAHATHYHPRYSLRRRFFEVYRKERVNPMQKFYDLRGKSMRVKAGTKFNRNLRKKFVNFTNLAYTKVAGCSEKEFKRNRLRKRVRAFFNWKKNNSVRESKWSKWQQRETRMNNSKKKFASHAKRLCASALKKLMLERSPKWLPATPFLTDRETEQWLYENHQSNVEMIDALGDYNRDYPTLVEEDTSEYAQAQKTKIVVYNSLLLPRRAFPTKEEQLAHQSAELNRIQNLQGYELILLSTLYDAIQNSLGSDWSTLLLYGPQGRIIKHVIYAGPEYYEDERLYDPMTEEPTAKRYIPLDVTFENLHTLDFTEEESDCTEQMAHAKTSFSYWDRVRSMLLVIDKRYAVEWNWKHVEMQPLFNNKTYDVAPKVNLGVFTTKESMLTFWDHRSVSGRKNYLSLLSERGCALPSRDGSNRLLEFCEKIGANDEVYTLLINGQSFLATEKVHAFTVQMFFEQIRDVDPHWSYDDLSPTTAESYFEKIEALTEFACRQLEDSTEEEVVLVAACNSDRYPLYAFNYETSDHLSSFEDERLHHSLWRAKDRVDLANRRRFDRFVQELTNLTIDSTQLLLDFLKQNQEQDFKLLNEVAGEFAKQNSDVTTELESQNVATAVEQKDESNPRLAPSIETSHTTESTLEDELDWKIHEFNSTTLLLACWDLHPPFETPFNKLIERLDTLLLPELLFTDREQVLDDDENLESLFVTLVHFVRSYCGRIDNFNTAQALNLFRSRSWAQDLSRRKLLIKKAQLKYRELTAEDKNTKVIQLDQRRAINQRTLENEMDSYDEEEYLATVKKHQEQSAFDDFTSAENETIATPTVAEEIVKEAEVIPVEQKKETVLPKKKASKAKLKLSSSDSATVDSAMPKADGWSPARRIAHENSRKQKLANKLAAETNIE